MFNKTIGHVECTFACHAKKIPQKGWSFFAKCVTMMRKCFWKQTFFLKMLILATENALLRISQKTFFTKPEKLQLKVGRWWKKNKKLIFQNKIFSFHLTCKKQFWQSCQKVYVRKPIIFHSMFHIWKKHIYRKTFLTQEIPLAVESQVLKFPPRTVHQKNFCADGRKMVKNNFRTENFARNYPPDT